jgi:hypothetical protein
MIFERNLTRSSDPGWVPTQVNVPFRSSSGSRRKTISDRFFVRWRALREDRGSVIRAARLAGRLRGLQAISSERNNPRLMLN